MVVALKNINAPNTQRDRRVLAHTKIRKGVSKQISKSKINPSIDNSKEIVVAPPGAASIKNKKK